jgi:alanyl-tRNA synthetase
LVDDDYLRFDFQSKDALTHHQIQEIEKQINTLIINAHTVKIEEMTYKNAISLGAKAFFEDKYGDIVRVVQILDGENMKNISLELCGGTHVSNTSEIGAFKILAQEAVASGIRRIVAVTGPQVAFSYQETQHQIELIAQKLECTPKQLDEKIDKTIKQIHVLQSENEKMLARQIDMALEKLAVTKIVQ